MYTKKAYFAQILSTNLSECGLVSTSPVEIIRPPDRSGRSRSRDRQQVYHTGVAQTAHSKGPVAMLQFEQHDDTDMAGSLAWSLQECPPESNRPHNRSPGVAKQPRSFHIQPVPLQDGLEPAPPQGSCCCNSCFAKPKNICTNELSVEAHLLIGGPHPGLHPTDCQSKRHPELSHLWLAASSRWRSAH